MGIHRDTYSIPLIPALRDKDRLYLNVATQGYREALSQKNNKPKLIKRFG